MRQHHALGSAGGAGGVDDGRQSLRVARHVARRPAIFGKPFRQRFHPCIASVGHRVDGKDAREAGELALDVRKRVPLIGALQQQHLAAGILENVSDVVRPVLGVERHHHQPQAQRRLVERHPFRRILQHHRDAVARLQTVALERRLPARDLAIDLRPGVVAPVVVLRIVGAVGDQIRGALHPLAEHPVERYRSFHGNQLTLRLCHGSSSFCASHGDEIRVTRYR